MRLEITSQLKISLETAQILLIELHSYLLGNLGENIYQDKESLKQKRTELFEFVEGNIFNHPEFVIARILKTLNERAQKLLPDLKYSNLSMIKVLINASLDLVNSLLTWLYGEEIFAIFFDRKIDDDTR